MALNDAQFIAETRINTSVIAPITSSNPATQTAQTLPLSTSTILNEQLVFAPRRKYKKRDKTALPTRSTRKERKEFLDKQKRDDEAFSNFLAQRSDNTHHRILPSTGAISFTDPTPILSTSLNTSSSNLIANPTTTPSNILPTNSTPHTVNTNNSSSSNNHIVQYVIDWKRG
jgi:hypothetical protein